MLKDTVIVQLPEGRTLVQALFEILNPAGRPLKPVNVIFAVPVFLNVKTVLEDAYCATLPNTKDPDCSVAVLCLTEPDNVADLVTSVLATTRFPDKLAYVEGAHVTPKVQLAPALKV